VSAIIRRFPKGTWVEQWPHKVNLDDKDAIYEHLMELARLKYPSDSSQHREKRRYDWMYNYVHELGNDAFLEIGRESYRGWVVFHTEEEVIKFILSHS
jgi:hypothetical protein